MVLVTSPSLAGGTALAALELASDPELSPTVAGIVGTVPVPVALGGDGTLAIAVSSATFGEGVLLARTAASEVVARVLLFLVVGAGAAAGRDVLALAAGVLDCAAGALSAASAEVPLGTAACGGGAVSVTGGGGPAVDGAALAGGLAVSGTALGAGGEAGLIGTARCTFSAATPMPIAAITPTPVPTTSLWVLCTAVFISESSVHIVRV
jgi:hypothetical protein